MATIADVLTPLCDLFETANSFTGRIHGLLASDFELDGEIEAFFLRRVRNPDQSGVIQERLRQSEALIHLEVELHSELGKNHCVNFDTEQEHGIPRVIAAYPLYDEDLVPTEIRLRRSLNINGLSEL